MSDVPDTNARLVAAQARSIAAHQRMSATVAQLQERLNPRTLARSAAREAADMGSSVARTGAETARRNPGAVAGAVAVAGLFLARHRIAALFGRKPASTPAQPVSHDPADQDYLPEG